ncbi:MAG: glycosyltransferase family 1 protein [Myxococcota bacterium]
MRIAIVSEVFVPKIDGITNRLCNTIECLVAAGHEVLVIAPAGSVAEYAGAPVLRVPGPRFPFYPGLRIGLPDPRIFWRLRRFRPDVVHVVGPVCLGLWALVAARLLRLPVVASYHTDLPGYLAGYRLGWLDPVIWPLLRAIHGLAHRNLCPSAPTKRELESHGIAEVGIWRGGVDTRLFDPRKRSVEARSRMVDDGRIDAPLLLYAGRIAPEKGLDRLRPVLAQLPGCRLAIVGDGPARAGLERFFAETPTRFLGFLRGEALAAAFASADVFVMPSMTETLGFVVLEAMSSGLPVVAAPGGGIPDLVLEGETGALADPTDPEKFAQRIREILRDDGRRAEYAARARRFAEDCDWPSQTRGLVAEYARTIRRVRGRRSGLPEYSSARHRDETPRSDARAAFPGISHGCGRRGTNG